VLLLGARAEIYLFPAVKLAPTLVAGVLSGFVTVVVLRLLAGPTPAGVEPAVVPARNPQAFSEPAISSEDKISPQHPRGEESPSIEADVPALQERRTPGSGLGGGSGRGDGSGRRRSSET
jgi:hypothetical protein